MGSDSVWLEKEQFCISNNTVIFKEHALKMSENLCSTKHTIGKLKDKPQTGRKYLHIIFLIKDLLVPEYSGNFYKSIIRKLPV